MHTYQILPQSKQFILGRNAATATATRFGLRAAKPNDALKRTAPSEEFRLGYLYQWTEYLATAADRMNEDEAARYLDKLTADIRPLLPRG